jgi:simple sugar transport system ATP-binding protein
LKPVAGKVHLQEKDLTGKPYHEFMANGVAYVPASRLEEGLIEGLTLNEHFILAEKQEGFIINRDKYKRITQERIQEFNIKGRPGSPVGSALWRKSAAGLAGADENAAEVFTGRAPHARSGC